jgi:hypothetical protein
MPPQPLPRRTSRDASANERRAPRLRRCSPPGLDVAIAARTAPARPPMRSSAAHIPLGWSPS